MSRWEGRWWRGGGGWASQTDAAQPVACLENVLDSGLMLLPSQLSNAVLIVYLSPSTVPPILVLRAVVRLLSVWTDEQGY